jgi:sigma-B regulation protein RsbU (phosphoserine phosphatase)
VDLGPFARLMVYSDGVYEIERTDGSTWQHREFVEFVTALRREGEALSDRLLAHVQELHGSNMLADDFSILEIQF